MQVGSGIGAGDDHRLDHGHDVVVAEPVVALAGADQAADEVVARVGGGAALGDHFAEIGKARQRGLDRRLPLLQRQVDAGRLDHADREFVEKGFLVGRHADHARDGPHRQFLRDHAEGVELLGLADLVEHAGDEVADLGVDLAHHRLGESRHGQLAQTQVVLGLGGEQAVIERAFEVVLFGFRLFRRRMLPGLVAGGEEIVLHHLGAGIVGADHPHVQILVPGHRVLQHHLLPGGPGRADEIPRVGIEDAAVDFDATLGDSAGAHEVSSFMNSAGDTPSS